MRDSETASLVVVYLPCRVEGGELFDRVVSVGKFSEPTAKLLFYQMLVAVKVGGNLLLATTCTVGPSSYTHTHSSSCLS